MKDLLAYRHTPKFAKKGNYGIRSVNQCDLRAFFVTYQSSSSCFDEIPRNQFRTYSWVFERFARKQVMQDLDKLVWGPGDGTQPNQGGNRRFHDDWILQTSSTLSSVITWNIATLLCSMHALHWLLEWEVMTFQLYSIVADQWRSIQTLSVKLKKILWRILELRSIVINSVYSKIIFARFQWLHKTTLMLFLEYDCNKGDHENFLGNKSL